MDEYVEEKLQDRDFFDAVMPKAMSFLQSKEVNRLRLYNLMAMRLGHTTGYKMTYKDIAKVTMNLHDHKPVTPTYCRMMYAKGLRLARRAINALGRTHND